MRRGHDLGSVLILLCLASFGASCSGIPMALTEGTSQLNTSEKSVALMTLRMSNQYVPAYEPNPVWLEVLDANQKGSQFDLDDAHDSQENKYNEYLVSFQLSPGHYTLGEVAGNTGFWSFPFVGRFLFPMDLEFDLMPGAIVYIGHVEMNNRERNGDEPRSGSIFPLIDQSVTGFSGGTFDIEVTDRFEEDLATFAEAYPLLKDHDVKKAIGKIAGADRRFEPRF